MKQLLILLQYAEASSEALATAKGLYHLPSTWKGVKSRNKRTALWQAKLIINGKS